MKYIDAEKLKKLIDEKWKELADKGVKVGGGKYEIEIYTYLSVLRLIDSLQEERQSEYVRKDVVIDAIKLAYGKVSMNPFDCSDAFEELLKKVSHEIH